MSWIGGKGDSAAGGVGSVVHALCVRLSGGWVRPNCAGGCTPGNYNNFESVSKQILPAPFPIPLGVWVGWYGNFLCSIVCNAADLAKASRYPRLRIGIPVVN